VRKANATSYHIFWDCPRNDTWRRQILPTYKANRKDSDPEIGEAIGLNLAILKKICPHVKMSQYYHKQLEADDLIYAFASLFHPTDIVVLSSDSDLSQIPFRFMNSRQLKPGGDFVDKPAVSPVLQKCLTGDKSDNIDGYRGIGPKKSEVMLQCPNKLYEFVAENPRPFLFNQNIVDLALCPLQMQSQYAVLQGIQDKPNFNLQGARDILSQYNMYPDLHDLDWSAFHENKE
jgi:5'-3' exonuclease